MTEPSSSSTVTMRTASGRQITLPVPAIPDHELLREIGAGSYGKVWLARNVMGYRAVKVIYRAVLEADRPFEREFEGLKRFEPISRTHPGLMDILQVGRNEAEGYFYCIMELADDQETGQRIQPDSYQPKTLRTELNHHRKLSIPETIRIGLALADALGFLHRQGLVHRDIKPSNIVFINGQPKLADVGLVTEIGECSLVGTPGYMAPEQAGKPEADLFSLGRLLYVSATGQAVADFPKLPEEPGAARERDLLELNQIWLKATAEDAKQRYHSAEEVQLHLSFLQAGQSVISHLRFQQWLRRCKFYAWVIPAVLILGLGGIGLYLREQKRTQEKRQRDAGSLVAYGSGAMREGDYLASLPAFAAALLIDQDDPARADTHRVRLGAMLQMSPRLLQMWFQDQPLVSVQFTRDGRRLLLGGPQGFSYLWDLASVGVRSPPFGSGLKRERAVLSPDEKWVATFSAEVNEPIRLWDAASGRKERELGGAQGVSAIGFSPDSRWLAAGLSEGRVLVWEAGSGRLGYELKGHAKAVLGVAFDHAGRRLASAAKDNTVRLWDFTFERCALVFTNHSTWVYQAAFSPDDTLVASVGFDRTARLWEAATGRETVPPMLHRDGVRSVAFDASGTRLVTACLGFSAQVWDTRLGRPAAPTLHHSSRVLHAAFSPDGRDIATVCWDGTARLWRLPTERSPRMVPNLVLSPDGRWSAAVSNRTVQVCDGLPGRSTNRFELPGWPVGPLQFDPRNTVLLSLVSASSNRSAGPWQACLQKVASGQAWGRAIPLAGAVTHAVLDPGGNRLAVGWRERVTLFDTVKGTALANLAWHDASLQQLAFDRDGRRLAVLTDETLQLHRLPALEPLWTEPILPPTSNDMTFRHMAFSPDGHALVAGWADDSLDPGAAGLWDADTGRPLGPVLTQRDGVLWADFSPKGERVVTTCEDFSAMIWGTRSGLPLIPDRVRQGDKIIGAGFGADGRWLFTIGSDRAARVWDAQTGEPITPPLAHPCRLVAAQFTADASALVTRDVNDVAWIWPLLGMSLPPEDLAHLAHLLAAHRTDFSGTLLPQSKADLRKSWERLRGLYPSLFGGE